MSVALIQNAQEGLLPGSQRTNNYRTHRAAAQMTFEISSLDELRAVYERMVEMGIPIRLTVNHGCSFVISAGGPDGSKIEVYWATGDRSISGRPCRGETR